MESRRARARPGSCVPREAAQRYRGEVACPAGGVPPCGQADGGSHGERPPDPRYTRAAAAAEGTARLRGGPVCPASLRSEEHTSELQSLMRISYAVFCLKKKKTQTNNSKQDAQYNHLTQH